MSYVDDGIGILVAVASEYGAAASGHGSARLEGLQLFVGIRQLKGMSAGPLSLCIAEVVASEHERGKGIDVTCVGREADMPAAVSDAMGQWCLGVLPVLAHWRGEHSCLSGSRPVQTQAGSFAMLCGPTVIRGASDEEAQGAMVEGSYVESLLPLIQKASPASRTHWLELYACKMHDGSVDSTCRLNNHDWPSGARLLSGIASAWPPVQAPILSCRQFVLLVPENGDAHMIAQPTFWERIRGRA